MDLENKIEAQRKRMEQEKNKLDMLMKKAKMEQRKADNHRKIVVGANFETFLNEPRRYSEEQTRRIMQVAFATREVKNCMEKIEREIDGAKESIATELERLENCPSLKEYREDSAGAGRNQNSWRGVGSVANWKQDNFAGKTWDEDRVQIQQKHSRNIDVLEKKRQALAAALDSMYLSS